MPELFHVTSLEFSHIWPVIHQSAFLPIHSGLPTFRLPRISCCSKIAFLLVPPWHELDTNAMSHADSLCECLSLLQANVNNSVCCNWCSPTVFCHPLTRGLIKIQVVPSARLSKDPIQHMPQPSCHRQGLSCNAPMLWLRHVMSAQFCLVKAQLITRGWQYSHCCMDMDSMEHCRL